jgi:hypothetical protein
MASRGQQDVDGLSSERYVVGSQTVLASARSEPVVDVRVRDRVLARQVDRVVLGVGARTMRSVP